MGKVTLHDPIRPGHPLWNPNWIVTIPEAIFGPDGSLEVRGIKSSGATKPKTTSGKKKLGKKQDQKKS